MVKNGCGYPALRTLELAVSQEGINRINDFWCLDTSSRKLKVILTIFGW